MRFDHGASHEYSGHPPHRGGGVHSPQHNQAFRKGPQPCILLQLNYQPQCILKTCTTPTYCKLYFPMKPNVIHIFNAILTKTLILNCPAFSFRN